MKLSEGNNQTLENDNVELLRLILEQEQKRTVRYDEAREIGETLICFFELLADGLDELINEQEPVLQIAS